MSETPEHCKQQHHEAFEGPIEAGKTFAMPAKAENIGEEDIPPDNYKLVCPIIDVQPKSVVLPKFVFNCDLGYKEKGMLLLNYHSDHKTKVYSKILKAARDGFSKLEIKFFDPDNELLSVWKFSDPRIHALDFGYVAEQRVEPGELAIEIDYRYLEIEDVDT